MAGRGPAGKERHTRDRNDPDFRSVSPAGSRMYGQPLPDGVLPDGEQWHAQTLAWWDAIRRSPLLAGEHEMGWQFLIDTALMHHVMWTKGRWEFAGELRLRVAKFGATPEDRMRLKVKIETLGESDGAVSSASAAAVTSIHSRRGRLSG